MTIITNYYYNGSIKILKESNYPKKQILETVLNKIAALQQLSAFVLYSEFVLTLSP